MFKLSLIIPDVATKKARKLVTVCPFQPSLNICEVGIFLIEWSTNFVLSHNTTALTRHLCRTTTVLSCHGCPINTSVEEQHLNKD